MTGIRAHRIVGHGRKIEMKIRAEFFDHLADAFELARFGSWSICHAECLTQTIITV
jgi:hypothetical protein